MEKINFDTYAEALEYFQNNFDKLEPGYTMGIDAVTCKEIRIYPPEKHENVIMPDTWKKTHFTSDGMDPIVNQADGKVYDSRSAYYKSLKESGNHILESGEKYAPTNPTASKEYHNELKRDLATTIQQLNQRRR